MITFIYIIGVMAAILGCCFCYIQYMRRVDLNDMADDFDYAWDNQSYNVRPTLSAIVTSIKIDSIRDDMIVTFPIKDSNPAIIRSFKIFDNGIIDPSSLTLGRAKAVSYKISKRVISKLEDRASQIAIMHKLGQYDNSDKDE
jgi:hypothetical protein